MKHDKNQKQREREFKHWFEYSPVRHLLECPMSYVDVALQLNGEYIDDDMREPAEEYAFLHLCDNLVTAANEAAAKKNRQEYKFKAKLIEELVVAYNTGKKIPKLLRGLYNSYYLRAHVVLSKPLRTLQDLPELPPMR